ncbi:hypothetical protein PGB90_003401 [Kerria lacca]
MELEVLRSPKINVKTLTPVLANRRTPLNTPCTPKENARTALHVSSIPESLPCRENEFKIIYEYVHDKISSKIGGFMYINGVPGTGKTATVQRVTNKLLNESKKNELNNFKLITINGFHLTRPQEIYRQIWKQYSGKLVSLKMAVKLLNKLFDIRKIKTKRFPMLLIIDEFDRLSNKKQDVIYRILEWKKEDCSQLIVLAIANTFNFFENKKLFSRVKFDKLSFIPYTYLQLEEIISNRLKGLDIYTNDAIQLVARKVAAISGDARRALNICRQILDITKEENENIRITIHHVTKAFDKIFSDPTILTIKSFCEMEKTALRAIRDELLRSDSSECSLATGVWDQFKTICTLEGLDCPSEMEVRITCQKLAKLGFLNLEQIPMIYSTKISLNIEPDVIQLALHGKKDSEFVGTVFLMFFGCLGGIQTVGVETTLHVAISWGLTVSSAVLIFGHISGCHINPAVTICSLILQKVTPLIGLLYFIAQMLGATIGFWMIYVVSPNNMYIINKNGTTTFCCTTHIPGLSILEGFVAEFMATGFLILGVCSAWDSRNANALDSFPLKIGFLISVAVFTIGPYTGAALNPARAFAPALVNNYWRRQWVYWIATLGAGIVASLFYKYIFMNSTAMTYNQNEKILEDKPED